MSGSRTRASETRRDVRSKIAADFRLPTKVNVTMPRVTPPSVNQMLITLERQGLIRRYRGVARSIKLLIDPSTLPQLCPSPGQPV
jgi:hypothetical protein